MNQVIIGNAMPSDEDTVLKLYPCIGNRPNWPDPTPHRYLSTVTPSSMAFWSRYFIRSNWPMTS